MRTESLDVVREYVDAVWNHGDLDALERLTSADFTYVLAGQPAMDRSAMRHFIEMTRRAFPDWQVTIVESVSDGDVVAIRWEGRVTHRGEFHGIPATGKQIAVSGINMYQLADGVIVVEREQMDSLGMLAQLGVGSK